MGDLVPQNARGSFFSKRTMVSTISAAFIGLMVGKLLDLVNSFTGFAIIFSVISLIGSLDILCFIWVKNPPMKITNEKLSIQKLFSEPFKDKNYIRFITFAALWNFGLNFAGPFFNVYMLENLKMGYLTLVLFAQISGNLVTILFIRSWGRLIDRYGNKPIMTICCSFIIILPFMWFFATPQNYYIVIFINILSGLFWPGFDLTCANQSVWLAPEKNRSMYIAVYTLITSFIGIAAAFVLGGAFMQFSKPIFENLNLSFFMGQKFSNFHALFALSGLFRLSALVFFVTRYKEANSKSFSYFFHDINRRTKKQN